MISNKQRSVFGVPIFGEHIKGRSKSNNFLLFYKMNGLIIVAVSKHPDRRKLELQKKYGSKIQHIITIHSFNGYKDKKEIQKRLHNYKIGKTDSYLIDTTTLFDFLQNANLSYDKNINERIILALNKESEQYG